MIRSLLVLAASVAVSELAHRALIPKLIGKGMVSKDVHKPGEVLVPEPLGPAVFSGVVIGAAVAYVLTGISLVLAIVASAGVAFLIGLLDDMTPLDARAKPLMLVLPALVLAPTAELLPRPILPILAGARLYYVYWLLLPIVYTVFSNGVNMMDALNGMMPLSIYASTLPLLPILIMEDAKGSLTTLLLLYGALLPYLIRNRYPARVFGGDSNSLMVGAVLAGVAATSRLEAFFALALLPHMVSGFSVIASLGGLKERREISERPVIVRNGIIRANPSERAPMSLIAMLTSHFGKSEPEVVRDVVLLSMLSGLLSLLTYLLLTPKGG